MSAPDTIAPTVSITAPANSASVTGVTTVSVSAADNVAVTRVELYVNNTLQSTLTSAPYNFSWNTSSLVHGSYTLSAKAYDAADNVGQSSSVVVTVPISVSMSTVISETTAVGTVFLSGIAAQEAFGLNVMVTGAQITSASRTAVTILASSPAVIGTTVILPSTVGFGPGAVLTVNFGNVPAGAVPADFDVSLVAVLDSTFNPIPIQ